MTQKASRLEKLIELAKLNGYDKLQHKYLKYFSKHLPVKPQKILEIGVLESVGVKMLKPLFSDCEIHGFDLFNEHELEILM